MSDKTVEQWAGQAARYGARIGRQKPALQSAVEASVTALNQAIRRSLPGGRMKGVKANGGRVAARVAEVNDTRGTAAIEGPWYLFENGSKPHRIRAHGQALKMANGHYARWVMHPGTKPRRVLATAIPAAQDKAADRWRDANVRTFRDEL